MKLKIEYLTPEQLQPYANNAKLHPDAQVEQIANSISEFEFSDPIGIWGDNEIVEGHGRLLAALKLGLKEVPVIRLDHLTDEQRRAYMLVHNQTTMTSGWNPDKLLAEQAKIDINWEAFGFNMEAAGSPDWFENRERNDRSRQEGNDEYNEFLDKFEDPKTTDDCYTPDNIYDLVADYVAKRYNVERKAFVRPFYPGGDYQRYKYKVGDVVVDNPPFSILAEIVDFYVENDQAFFLFAPALAALNYVNRKRVAAICAYVGVTYENGASVSTSFITNMEPEDIVAIADPELYAQVEKTNEENEKAMHRSFPKYEYPVEIVTAARLGYLSKYGQALRIRRSEAMFVRSLDAMKESGKGIYGGALLLGEKTAAEKAAAEKAAAEKAAATCWPLSAREKELIKSLGGGEHERL